MTPPTPAEHARAREIADTLRTVWSYRAVHEIDREHAADVILQALAQTRAEALEAAARVAETAEEWALHEECDRKFWSSVDEWLKNPKPETRPCPVPFFAAALATARAEGRAQGWRARGEADAKTAELAAVDGPSARCKAGEHCACDIGLARDMLAAIRALPAAPPEEGRTT